MRRHHLLAAALLAGSLTTVGVSPAGAEGALVVPTPDVSTPGHAIGTVEGLGEAAYVLVDLGNGHTWPGPDAMFPVEAGVATYDLETWGLRSPVDSSPDLHVGAVPCTSSERTSCAGTPTVSPAFQPTDVAPAVTWPDDTTIGPGETVSITVSDPQGGGDLRAAWVTDEAVAETVLPGRNGTFDIPVHDGVGSLIIRRCMAGSPYFCDAFDPPVEQQLDVRTSPVAEPTVVTSITRSRGYVRPEATGAASSVDLTATGSGGTPADAFWVVGPSGSDVRPLDTTWGDGAWTATFDGRRPDGRLLSSGSYRIELRNGDGPASGPSTTVSVQRLVLRTHRRTVTAAGSRVDRYVGRCSTLRAPASRGWSGSHGYYANTRCRSNRGTDGVVLTVNRVRVPAAAKYLDVSVKTYGGASRRAAGSTAVIQYLTRNADVVALRHVGSRLGWHSGATVRLRPLVDSRRHVHWALGTAKFNRYDVKQFTVVARYYVWQ